MKYLLVLLMLPFAAMSQKTNGQLLQTATYYIGDTIQRTDTVRATLHITNSKLNRLQYVPGYVLMQNGCVKGYLSRQRKELPKKVEVWGYTN